MNKMNEALLCRGCPPNAQDPAGQAEITGQVHPGCAKLDVYDWLHDIPHCVTENDLVEVRFKNTHKAYYRNINSLHIKVGDLVAVEASPGHDIGMVSLSGELVWNQLAKMHIQPDEYEFRKLYRKAKAVDLEKWRNAIAREYDTMIRSRQIAQDLKLDMKIGDVEYQGDGTKAIFYYIAEERVDFRELIKVLAEEFHIRIEMRQIGARQEAGRIGGIGSCGRELCCASWITNFVSVTTNAARQQELSLNPQKLAGQCGKLKCCLNYEVDSYLEARKDFPSAGTVLETDEGKAYHQKTDIFKRVMWYSFNSGTATNLVAVPVERVWEIIHLNEQGIIPDKLAEKTIKDVEDLNYTNAAGQESLTRFDRKSPRRLRPKPRVRKRRKE